jgi:hypothetical protein
MNKMTFSTLFRSVQTTLSKRSPEILTGVGIAGMIGTTIMAVKATPKAIELIEERKKELRCEELHPVEVVKTAWRCYIPAAVTGAASALCLVKAVSISTRRSAALLTAYNLSETAYKEYKEKVLETVGERKEKIIRDQIAQDKVNDNPVQNNEVIVTERGTTLCYDAMFGRYFLSDIDAIKRAMNNINADIFSGNMYASLNDFYDELGLEPVEIGDKLGWNTDDKGLEVLFSSTITKDNRACVVISYNIAPDYNYNYFC